MTGDTNNGSNQQDVYFHRTVYISELKACSSRSLQGCRFGAPRRISHTRSPGRQLSGRCAPADAPKFLCHCNRRCNSQRMLISSACVARTVPGGVRRVGTQATSLGASEDIIDGHIGQDVQV